MAEVVIESRDDVPLKAVLAGTNAPFSPRKVGEETFLDFEAVSEYPFHFDETGTLLATSASSPLVLVASARVGSGFKAKVDGFYWRKPGNQAWASSDLSLQDTAGNEFVNVPQTAILSASYGTMVTPATYGDALFDGGAEGRGVQVVGSDDEAAGNVEVRVFGSIVPA